MKLDEYNSIVNFIHRHPLKCSRAILADVISNFGERFPYHTLVSIFLNELQRKVKRTYHAKSQEEEVKFYYKIYKQRIEKYIKKNSRISGGESCEKEMTSVVKPGGKPDDSGKKGGAEQCKEALPKGRSTLHSCEISKNKDSSTVADSTAAVFDDLEPHCKVGFTDDAAIPHHDMDIKNNKDAVVHKVAAADPVLIILANEFGIPPFLMARLIVERYLVLQREVVAKCAGEVVAKGNWHAESSCAVPNGLGTMAKTIDSVSAAVAKPVVYQSQNGHTTFDLATLEVASDGVGSNGPSGSLKEDLKQNGIDSLSSVMNSIQVTSTGSTQPEQRATSKINLSEGAMASIPVPRRVTLTAVVGIGTNTDQSGPTNKSSQDSVSAPNPAPQKVTSAAVDCIGTTASTGDSLKGATKMESQNNSNNTSSKPPCRRVALTAVYATGPGACEPHMSASVGSFEAPGALADKGPPQMVERSPGLISNRPTVETNLQKDKRDSEEKSVAKNAPPGLNFQTSIKNQLSVLMKDANLIPDETLREQVLQCASYDVCFGPINDAIRQAIGLEYEAKLLELVKQHDLPFLDENDLRKRGYDKTPDVKLEVPIAVDGHPVCWIESKASFGDLDTHGQYLSGQYYSYWNRFGPGLVIYWFGFVAEISDEMLKQGILIMDGFPTDDQITFMSP